MFEFIRTRGFQKRAKVSVGIVLVVAIGVMTPNFVGLRIVYVMAAVMATVECVAMRVKPVSGELEDNTILRMWVAAELYILLMSAVIGMSVLPAYLVMMSFITAIANDTFAYLFGKACGRRFIKRLPFPHISPTKSWEGCIGGVVCTGIAVGVAWHFFHVDDPMIRTVVMCDFGGSLVAIAGDLAESYVKHGLGFKDACDPLLNTRWWPLAKIESLLGGKDGHGGYFDRIDALSWVSVYNTMIYLALFCKNY